jgi:hypothetical protein
MDKVRAYALQSISAFRYSSGLYAVRHSSRVTTADGGRFPRKSSGLTAFRFIHYRYVAALLAEPLCWLFSPAARCVAVPHASRLLPAIARVRGSNDQSACITVRDKFCEGALPRLLLPVSQGSEFSGIQSQFARHLDMSMAQSETLPRFKPRLKFRWYRHQCSPLRQLAAVNRSTAA